VTEVSDKTPYKGVGLGDSIGACGLVCYFFFPANKID